MTGYHVHSFGCRASAADGDAIASELERAGGLLPAPLENASVIVINTCAVTEEAERSARALIRRARRRNPEARIVVTGCYAQRAPDAIKALPGVDVVIGNSHKHETATVALQNFIPLTTLHAPFPAAPYAGEHTLLFAGAGRTRPNLKVQDGCNNRCSFCVIPETRGPSRSVPLQQAVQAAQAFADTGGQELVLSGINLGRWGRDLRPTRTLPELVATLLDQTTLPRLRISSVEPMDWTRDLLALYARHTHGQHPRLAPHAHLPLQSGADAILRRMHRRYRPWHYAEKTAALRALLPDAAIGADVMVGFPGETDALFQESYSFIEAQPFTYLHLFPFSPRPGTAAAPWHRERPVPHGAVRERMAALDELAARKKQAFLQQFPGKQLSAVTLRDGTALSANFIPLALTTQTEANRLVSVRIASINEGILTGELAPR